MEIETIGGVNKQVCAFRSGVLVATSPMGEQIQIISGECLKNKCVLYQNGVCTIIMLAVSLSGIQDSLKKLQEQDNLQKSIT